MRWIWDHDGSSGPPSSNQLELDTVLVAAPPPRLGEEAATVEALSRDAATVLGAPTVASMVPSRERATVMTTAAEHSVTARAKPAMVPANAADIH